MAATDTASRICGNSAILFVRTALVAICGAAAVRIAVDALGADGYGTYASFLIAAVPSAVVFAFAPELIRVWLGEAAPPQVAAFVRCSVVNLVFDAASNPLTTTILASGRVAFYHSVACSLSVLGFAVAWLLLASGFPAWTSMAAVAATNGLALVYRALHVWFILSRNSSDESTAT